MQKMRQEMEDARSQLIKALEEKKVEGSGGEAGRTNGYRS